MEDQGREPVFAYCFTRQLPGDDAGAFHGGDSWYTFETLNRCWRPFTGIDYELALRMADYFANFVRSGDPNGKDLPIWTGYSRAAPLVMEWGEQVGMITNIVPEALRERIDSSLGCM